MGVAVPETESNVWTPYPHEDVRVQLLWRKRIILAVILGLLFLLWALSLNVTTDTEEQLTVYGGDGSSVTVDRPDDSSTQPAASVTLTPGETARLDDDLTLEDESSQSGQRSGQIPDQPEGIPFLGLLLLLGPFILALLLWRYLANQGASTEVNYGVYKGALPLELVTATHSDLVLTGKRVEHNPFGKGRTDYLRDAAEDLGRGDAMAERRGPTTG